MDFQAVTDKTCLLIGHGERREEHSGIRLRERVLQALCCEKSGSTPVLVSLADSRGEEDVHVSCHLSDFSTSSHVDPLSVLFDFSPSRVSAVLFNSLLSFI